MHILFLTSEYPKKGFPHGGVGTVVQNIARGLVKHHYKVSVVGLNYTNNQETETDRGVVVYRLKPKKLKPFTWYLNYKSINKTIKEIHQKQPIDIIESTELGLAFIQKLKGIQYLIRMNGGHHFFAESEQRRINPWKAFQEKQSFKKADYVIGVSEYVVQHTLKYIDFKDKFQGVIYNIANLDRFKPIPTLKETEWRVFFAGSLCEKKGIRQLIKAMPKVIKAVPSAHLVVAGRDTKIRGTQNSYLNYLKTEIDPKIKHKIAFLGNIENDKLNIEIGKAKVCVYPSHMEAMPLAWLEVLAMGKPFVASNLGPGNEVVLNNKTGLLCNPFHLQNLAGCIIKLLVNTDIAQKLGKNAINDVNERFEYKTLVKQNVNLYKNLIKS
jgi:glycosyltransferase involved in cell wall biosynthesis